VTGFVKLLEMGSFALVGMDRNLEVAKPGNDYQVAVRPPNVKIPLKILAKVSKLLVP
jgi:hypothetical protein